MTEFTKQECLRLIDKLAETDPATEAYHILLSSIERFDSIGNTVDEIAQLREGAAQQVVINLPGLKEQMKQLAVEAPTPPAPEDNVVPFEATDFPAEVKDDLVKDVPPADPPAEEKTYDPAEVRTALCDARNKGVNVSAVLQKYGVNNFQNLPASQYGALMKELEAL